MTGHQEAPIRYIRGQEVYLSGTANSDTDSGSIEFNESNDAGNGFRIKIAGNGNTLKFQNLISGVYTDVIGIYYGGSTVPRVGIGNATTYATATLAVNSTTQGFLPPRMTGTQRDAITSPETGLMVYNTTTNKLNVYTGAAWEAITSA